MISYLTQNLGPAIDTNPISFIFITDASTSLTEPASIYAISSSNEIREFQLFAQFPVGSHIHYEIDFFPKAPEIYG